MTATPPSALRAVAALARITLLRLARGRAIWVGVAIALLPVGFAAMLQGRPRLVSSAFVAELLALAVLAPMFIASSIGEEIEDRTTTYLWSRPLPRWTVLVGKLVALAPIAVALAVGSWYAAIQFGAGQAPPSATMAAIAMLALAYCLVATGIATLAPKQGMALTIVYVLFFDFPVGEIPAQLQILSVTHQAKLIAGLDELVAPGEPAITMAVLAGMWLAVGLWRIRRLES